MLRQLAAVETLVPPNFNTTQGDVTDRLLYGLEERARMMAEVSHSHLESFLGAGFIFAGFIVVELVEFFFEPALRQHIF